MSLRSCRPNPLKLDMSQQYGAWHIQGIIRRLKGA